MLDLILNERFINGLFIGLAIGLPVIAVVVYLAIKKKGVSPQAALWLIVIGIAGPANLVLWQMFNFIENRLGLDSVAALLINIVLFLLVAVAAGMILARIYVRLQLAHTTVEHPDEDAHKTDPEPQN
jgi:hypothetical protein